MAPVWYSLLPHVDPNINLLNEFIQYVTHKREDLCNRIIAKSGDNGGRGRNLEHETENILKLV